MILTHFLDEKAVKGEKVTRAELDDWIKNHDLQIEEKVLDKDSVTAMLDEWDDFEDNDMFMDLGDPDDTDVFMDPDANDLPQDGNPDRYSTQHKYKEYSTVGRSGKGTNYRSFIHTS